MKANSLLWSTSLYFAAITTNIQGSPNKSEILTQNIEKKLEQGLYQEVIWRLEEEGTNDASLLRTQLANIMKKSIISSNSIKNLGGGATDTKLITLSSNVRAVFKIKNNIHPSSNFASEVAAYKIDQLGKFSLVPMTIIRHVDGKIGSLQYFVNGTKSALEIYNKSANLEVFDYIIRNNDRTANNILITNKEREVAIDHGLSFNPNSSLGKFLKVVDKFRNIGGVQTLRQRRFYPKTNPEKFLASDRIIHSLRLWTLDKLINELYPLLSKKQISMVYKKTKKLLKYHKKYSNNRGVGMKQ